MEHNKIIKDKQIKEPSVIVKNVGRNSAWRIQTM